MMEYLLCTVGARHMHHGCEIEEKRILRAILPTHIGDCNLAIARIPINQQEWNVRRVLNIFERYEPLTGVFSIKGMFRDFTLFYAFPG